MKCAVIGLGEFGRAAAEGLAQNGAEVIAVDIRLEEVNAVKDQVALAVCLDATEEDTLEAHGIRDVDVLIAAIGSNFEAQVLVVVHAKTFGIKRIVARATTLDHRRVLKAVGADEVLNPEEEAARWMVQRLMISNISSYFELAEGFSVVEVSAPEGIIGKTLEELNLRRRFRLNLVSIKRFEMNPQGEKVLREFNPVPLPTEIIQKHDALVRVFRSLNAARRLSDRRARIGHPGAGFCFAGSKLSGCNLPSLRCRSVKTLIACTPPTEA